MEGLKIVIDGMLKNRTQFLLLLGFGLFPIYTSMADLPFWNDIAMRIMLLGMAAMGLNLVLGYGGMVSFGHAAFVGIGAYCVGISQYYGLFNGWVHVFMALGSFSEFTVRIINSPFELIVNKTSTVHSF